MTAKAIQSRNEIPRNVLRGKAMYEAVISWAVTQVPLLNRKVIPLKILIVPSVVMIGGILP